jgi:hypothetical protein
MPRLNLSMSDNFSPSARTQPGGRRVRSLSGVEIAEERRVTRTVASLALKAGAVAAIAAAAWSSPLILRLLHLSH